MAILKSPHYQGLSIYVGENPIPGSFYSPKSGENISVIANKAYKSGTITPVLRINKSEWNIANCAYRKKSANCYSEHVDSTLARGQSGWGDGAWIAICQVDAQGWARQLGLPMPVIWIPTVNGEEPDDLAPILKPGFGADPEDVPEFTVNPETKPEEIRFDATPDDDKVPPEDDDEGGGGPTPGDDLDEHGCRKSAGEMWCAAKNRCIQPWNETCDDGITPQPKPGKKRAIWPWVLVGGILVAGGVYLAMRKKKK